MPEAIIAMPILLSESKIGLAIIALGKTECLLGTRSVLQ